MQRDNVTFTFIDNDFEVSELNHSAWEDGEKVSISTYWNAETAPANRQFSVRNLWSERNLYVRFETELDGGLVVAAEPMTDRKTIGLWERDVCEIFIAPDKSDPQKYFEFEVAPTGEWLDLGIDTTNRDRATDWEYASGMNAAASIDKGRVYMAISIPWEAFGRKPKAGDVWLGNIFRCVGSEPDRGYLSWRPTMAETPNFHVPEVFGEFVFRS